MKQAKYALVSLVIACVTIVSCKMDNKNDRSEQLSLVTRDTSTYTQVKFIDSLQDFGTVKKGQLVKLKYRAMNVGDYPLYIIAVQPSCGCTVADYTKGAILPGKSGLISATFDSNHGSAGDIHKSIIVTTNSKNSPNFVVAFNGKVTE